MADVHLAGRDRGLRAALATVVALLLLGGLLTALHPATSRTPPPARAAASATASTSASSAPVPAADARRSSRVAAVTALLHRRAAAVRSGDLRAFLADIDPAADPRFRAAQRALFANLRGVPLATWTYQLTLGHDIDTRGLARQPGHPDALWAPRLALDYALAGVDPRPTARPLGYLFAHHGGRWYLTSDTALAGRGRTTWRGPWDYGPCLTLRTRSGLVVYHPGAVATAQRIAGQLDAAVGAVTAVWGTGWPRTVAVFVPQGADELRALVGPEFSADSIAAVAVADHVDNRTHTVSGQRVVLNPDGAAQLSTTALTVVLRHEITHLAARADTVDGAPMWVLEGFADYVGYASSGVPMPRAAPDLAAAVRAGVLPANLPADRDFDADASDIDLAYQQAWTVNLYVAQRFSQPTLVRMYRTIAAAGPVDDARLDQLLRGVLGIGRDALVAGWRDYLRATLH